MHVDVWRGTLRAPRNAAASGALSAQCQCGDMTPWGSRTPSPFSRKDVVGRSGRAVEKIARKIEQKMHFPCVSGGLWHEAGIRGMGPPFRPQVLSREAWGSASSTRLGARLGLGQRCPRVRWLSRPNDDRRRALPVRALDVRPYGHRPHMHKHQRIASVVVVSPPVSGAYRRPSEFPRKISQCS